MEKEEISRDYTIRAVNIEDVPFIYNSWLKSYRESPSVRNIPNGVYYNQHHRAIEGVFNGNSPIVLIACNPEYPDQIYGYVVADSEIVGNDSFVAFHWVYCKHTFRGRKIGTALIEKVLSMCNPTSILYTHYVRSLDKVLKDRGYIYNPYYFWSKLCLIPSSE